MSDDYKFKVVFNKPVDISRAITFFSDEGFKFRGIFYAHEDSHEVSLEEAIRRVNDDNGTIPLNRDGIEIGFFYQKKYRWIVLSLGHYLLEKEGVKEVLKDFVGFVKKNYPVKNIKEYMGYKQQPYPFALKDDK
ncbi:MAG: hypothetical protein KJ709_05295 [Nanoarchaeota archaeon]|nr:hypothetical protein [Nanoarchaeota archaeon]